MGHELRSGPPHDPRTSDVVRRGDLPSSSLYLGLHCDLVPLPLHTLAAAHREGCKTWRPDLTGSREERGAGVGRVRCASRMAESGSSYRVTFSLHLGRGCTVASRLVRQSPSCPATPRRGSAASRHLRSLSNRGAPAPTLPERSAEIRTNCNIHASKPERVVPGVSFCQRFQDLPTLQPPTTGGMSSLAS
jgi:hypothetical protein